LQPWLSPLIPWAACGSPFPDPPFPASAQIPPAERARARVWLAGHSSGGALCQLAALRLGLALEGGPAAVGGVLLFNADRVGSAAFARHYDGLLGERTLRFGYGLGAALGAAGDGGLPRAPGSDRPVRA
jgi:hypothetical protein